MASLRLFLFPKALDTHFRNLLTGILLIVVDDINDAFFFFWDFNPVFPRLIYGIKTEPPICP